MGSSGGYDTHELKRKLAKLSHLDLAGYIIHKQPYASNLGGHSDVFSAWSTTHGKRVAVKQIRIFMKNDMSFAKVHTQLLLSIPSTVSIARLGLGMIEWIVNLMQAL